MTINRAWREEEEKRRADAYFEWQAMKNTPPKDIDPRRVVYDSGWFNWRRGEPLPPIESFRVPR